MPAVAFMGAHRTGKTTLAAELAKEKNVRFIKTECSQALREIGVDPKVDLSFEERLKAQEHLLDYLNALFTTNADQVFVTDRTPLDVLGYTLSELPRQMSQDVASAVERHRKRAIDLTMRHIAGLMLLQPGIALVEDAKSAPATTLYVEKVNALMMVALQESAAENKSIIHAVLPRTILDLSRRVSNAVVFFDATMHVVTQDQTEPEQGRILH